MFAESCSKGMKKERIDKMLVEGGFADSKKKAMALVMSGIVLANDNRVEKASEVFAPDIEIRLKDGNSQKKYVGRGGIKLKHALKNFDIRTREYVCIDIGSSTGGFTDCLLQNDAQKVYAIDVGTNQLDWSLRNDERVDVREQTNARDLKPQDFDQKADLVVMDVSFISVKKIFPAILPLLKKEGRLISLIKPQFEVTREEVEEGGIITDTKKHERVVSEVNKFASNIGFRKLSVIDSPILGAKGNKEFLGLYEPI